MSGEARFAFHGGPGRRRADGSEFDLATDREAFAAEAWGCAQFACPVNAELGRDPGYDCRLRVDFKWLGLRPDGRARRYGHLVVNPGPLTADLYMVIWGSEAEGFGFVGFATRLDLERAEVKDFGFGPKRAIRVDRLHCAAGAWATV